VVEKIGCDDKQGKSKHQLQGYYIDLAPNKGVMPIFIF